MEAATSEKTPDASAPVGRPASDGVRIALIGVVGGLIGALGALLGTYITSTNEVANRVRDAEVKLAEVRAAAEGRARDADVRLVEIGVGVLRAKPDEDGAVAAREWAIDLIERRSGIRFSEAAKAQLKDKPLRYDGTYSYYTFTPDAGWDTIPGPNPKRENRGSPPAH